ncbi:MAG: hypothetical protein B6D56_04340 [Candidatus Omnitrophica bacterium 4484_70.1]|nr:MAG: hypothetical protein B6D56_04340 [Candidatus Omnitrophica bacterium 4484_70.1]
MFFPQRMQLVKIFVVKEFLDKLCEILYKFGFIEVRSPVSFLQEKKEGVLMDTNNLLTECERLKERVKKVVRLLNIRPMVKEGGSIEVSTQTVTRVNQSYNKVISQVEELSQRIKDNQQRINELTISSTLLNIVEEKGIRLDSLKGSENIVVKVGVVTKEFFSAVESYDREGIVVEIKGEFVGNVFVFCLALREKEEELLGFLKSVKFKEVPLVFKGVSLGEIIESLEFEIWRLREEIVECRRQLGKIKTKYGNELSLLLPLLEESAKVYRVMSKFLVLGTGYVISGWVPQSKIKKLKDRLKREKGRVYFEQECAESLIARGFSIKDIPSYLGHKLLNPFEKILKFYGIPAYHHFDPTLFMALSFVVMFGMMFADLGHGLSLILLGIVLSFFKRLRNALGMFLFCGTSSAIFGIIFGSCFGKETVWQPLWFSPMRNPQRFLLIGIGWGVIMITLGIILNILQNLRNRKVKEAVFSQWGMISLTFYWMALYFIGVKVRYNLNISWGKTLIIFFLPLFILTLGNLLGRVRKDMAGVIFAPVEMVLDLVTNTISFVRVAAFGLAHAALGGCVYLIANSLGNLLAVKESIILEGNIGIILFEGLIVFIQVLRLEFYEFFSKFFHLEGKEFRPLRERR